jgi:hypothetical protein
MADPNLNYTELTAGQTTKETTVNTALGILSAASNEALVVDLTSADHDLTATEQTTHIFIRCQNNAVARTLGLNTNVGSGANTAERLLFIANEGTAVLTVDDVDVGGGTGIVIAPGVTVVAQVDGTNINLVMSSGNADAVSDWKESVRCATNAAGTLATSFENGDTVDTSITLATGDRILIKDQATASENGIYTVNASGAPTRAVDFVNPLVSGGAAVVVEEGTANADTIWGVTNDGDVDVGTDNITFAALGGGGGVTTLVGLSDTPANFTGAAYDKVRVNSGETAVEFVDDPHDLGAQFGGALPVATTVIWKFIATRAFELPGNLVGTQGHLGTADGTGTFVLDLDKNGTTIGTISFTSASQVETSLTTTAGAAQAVAVGDYLELSVNARPGAPADLALSLKARRTE